jgi:integrase
VSTTICTGSARLASNWEAKGVPVHTIQFMLGHKSLETTMRYLGIVNLDSLTDKIDAAAANVGD